MEDYDTSYQSIIIGISPLATLHIYDMSEGSNISSTLLAATYHLTQNSSQTYHELERFTSWHFINSHVLYLHGFDGRDPQASWGLSRTAGIGVSVDTWAAKDLWDRR